MELATSAKSFFIKCQRVWHILKKPTTEEFWTVAKISALGIFIIGMLGFVISIAVHVFG
jgi:protein transport protein SEC61 subunit gamma-like protein